MLEDLVADSNNPKSFWNKLKKLCNDRQQLPNNITIEQWKQHFETLFTEKMTNYSVDENKIENDDVIFDVTLDELEYIIFNSKITNEEILRSIQALRRGKSPGIKELIP